MNTAAFHPNAGPNRVDTVVVGLHSNFCAFAGYPNLIAIASDFTTLDLDSLTKEDHHA